MKKLSKAVVVIVALVIMMFTLTACGSTALSSYEIAVKNGFDGTEAQWLASLKGQDGVNGSSSALSYDDYEKWKADTGNVDITYDVFLKQFTASDNFAAAISSAARSVVAIRAGYNILDEGAVTQAGSGVIIQDDKTTGTAYIVTNYHVLYVTAANRIGNNIFVYLYGYDRINGEMTATDKYTELYGGSPIRATYIGGSMLQDLAVIKIENSNIYKQSDSVAIADSQIGDSESITMGTTAIAIGNPEAYGIAATQGIVSVPNEYLTLLVADDKTASTMRVIRVDTAINGGNSGGGLFNNKGELIGIVSAKTTKTNIDNMGYAIPVNTVMALAHRAIEQNKAGTLSTGGIVSRNALGITTKVVNSRSVYDSVNGTIRTVETITVDGVIPNYGQARNYLINGDVLKSATLNGTTVALERTSQLETLLYSGKEGDILTLKIERGGKAMTVQVPLGPSFSIDAQKLYSNAIDYRFI